MKTLISICCCFWALNFDRQRNNTLIVLFEIYSQSNWFVGNVRNLHHRLSVSLYVCCIRTKCRITITIYSRNMFWCVTWKCKTTLSTTDNQFKTDKWKRLILSINQFSVIVDDDLFFHFRDVVVVIAVVVRVPDAQTFIRYTTHGVCLFHFLWQFSICASFFHNFSLTRIVFHFVQNLTTFLSYFFFVHFVSRE